MKFAGLMMVMGVGLSLSACATIDVPTRNIPYEALPAGATVAPAGYQNSQITDQIPAQQAAVATSAPSQDGGQATSQLVARQVPVTIDAVNVRVPRSLKVSERNGYLPFGDIVWREDPIGDRHAQVAKIMQDALVQGVAPLDGPVHANLEVQVNRFHALTERARYKTGGVHSISFDMVLTDPKTGEYLVPVRTVDVDLKAFGGLEALAAERRGQTQKVRINDYLVQVIQQELTNPEGYQNASMGLIQWANRL